MLKCHIALVISCKDSLILYLGVTVWLGVLLYLHFDTWDITKNKGVDEYTTDLYYRRKWI